MANELDRRHFFQLAATSLGAATLASLPLAALCAHTTEPPALVESHSGETATKGKLLVAYASVCGSTKEVAQAVTSDLIRRGYSVDLAPAEKVAGLSGYHAIVVGSAVRFGKWLPESTAFVKKYQADLKRLPTAFFSVHGLNTGSDEASRKARLGYTEPIRAMVQPGVEAFFAGKMDIARLSFGVRMICRVMKARNADLRNWPAIHSWAETLFAAKTA